VGDDELKEEDEEYSEEILLLMSVLSSNIRGSRLLTWTATIVG
jgi:hypothetical protein